MPRDIPIGNGNLLIAFDEFYQIRDVYFPFVGSENHSQGHPFRFGVWADGRFAWTSDPGWNLDLNYAGDTLVTQVVLRNETLGVELTCNDTVDFYVNALVRKIVVKDLNGSKRTIRLFFHHDFHLYGTDVGDTATFDPNTHAMLHFKNNRYFMVTAWRHGEYGFDQYAAGKKEWDGVEGTWKDAEDGLLSNNPVDQGSVDSTFGLEIRLEPHGTNVCYYVLVAGEQYREVRDLLKTVKERTPEEFLRRTGHYWRLWVHRFQVDLGCLPEAVRHLYRRSLMILRTNIDNRGAIIAANDTDILRFNRDTYSYMWPRDGSLVARALDHAGYGEPTRRFFDLCRTLVNREGYFLHKFNPDGSPGSTWHAWVEEGHPRMPIQIDETGLVIWALWHHYTRYRDVEFISPLYKPLIKNAADFLVRFREPGLKLPQASFDLWEEVYGIHTFSSAAVYGGLKAAQSFAEIFGETDLAAQYGAAAEEVKQGMLEHLWMENEQRFARSLIWDGKAWVLDPALDASVYGVFAFGVWPADDPKVVSTMKAVQEGLCVKTEVGGIARKEGDTYQQVVRDPRVPGNPWFICTLWLAQHQIACAHTLEDLEAPMELVSWVASRALPSGVLAEQVHPLTDEPLSVSPLTWSHGELVETVLQYLDKRQALDLCDACGGERSHDGSSAPDPEA